MVQEGSGEDNVCERTIRRALSVGGKNTRVDRRKKKTDVCIVPDREKLMSRLFPSPWLTSGLTTGFNT